MKFAVVALLAGSAAAFAPVQTSKASTALKMVNELEIGATAPLGVFDPLGWLDNEPESFERRRDRKSTRLNSSHRNTSRMPSSA